MKLAGHLEGDVQLNKRHYAHFTTNTISTDATTTSTTATINTATLIAYATATKANSFRVKTAATVEGMLNFQGELWELKTKSKDTLYIQNVKRIYVLYPRNSYQLHRSFQSMLLEVLN